MRSSLFAPLLLGLALSIASCEKASLEIPEAYDGSSFTANTVAESSVLGQITALDNLAKTGRTAGTVLAPSDLLGAYSAGAVDLSLLTVPGFAQLVTGNGGLFSQLAQASGGTYDPFDPASTGGVYGGYLFDAAGAEPGEILNKGLYGALLYYRAVQALTGEISASDIDQALALYGAHPDFANSDNAVLHDHPDGFMAKYTARRDKNDGNGLYTGIRDHFIVLQAAVAQGFPTERDEAAGALRLNWEKAIAATVINYLYQATGKLTLTNPTSSDFGSALHALGEAYGFLLGWYLLPAEHRTATDAQLAEVLATLHFPVGGAAEPERFVQNPAAEVARLLQGIDLLQAVYGFSESEVTDFQKNWVSEQGR
jgi:hypothetical protein